VTENRTNRKIIMDQEPRSTAHPPHIHQKAKVRPIHATKLHRDMPTLNYGQNRPKISGRKYKRIQFKECTCYQRLLNYLAMSVSARVIWWMLFWKRVVRTKLDIYGYITISNRKKPMNTGKYNSDHDGRKYY
jgi:hypothetical protein